MHCPVLLVKPKTIIPIYLDCIKQNRGYMPTGFPNGHTSASHIGETYPLHHPNLPLITTAAGFNSAIKVVNSERPCTV